MKKIVTIYLGRKGGAVPYSYEMVKSLLDQDIHILCILSELICNKEEWISLENRDKRLQLIFIHTFSTKFEFFLDLFIYKPYRNAIQEIVKFNPDAIYLPMISLGVRKLLRGIRHFPIVTTIHDFYQHPGMENPIIKYIFDRIEKASSKFVVLTEKFVPLIENKYGVPPQNICHIPHANFSYYNESGIIPTFKTKFNILFFGRISKYKGITILLTAMKTIVNKLPEIKLTIVGQGTLGNEDKKIISQFPDSIRVINQWIPDNMVWNYFADADLTVLPYIEASQSGVAALSFSCGRTVVATNVGGLDEQVLPAGGIVVKPNDPIALANAIIELYMTEKLTNLNKRAYEYAITNLTWKTSAMKLINFIYD